MTNTVFHYLHVEYKKSQTHRKRTEKWLPRARGWGKWGEAGKRV